MSCEYAKATCFESNRWNAILAWLFRRSRLLWTTRTFRIRKPHTAMASSYVWASSRISHINIYANPCFAVIVFAPSSPQKSHPHQLSAELPVLREWKASSSSIAKWVHASTPHDAHYSGLRSLLMYGFVTIKLPKGPAPKATSKGFNPINRYKAAYFDKGSGAPILHAIFAIFAIGYTIDYQMHLKHHKVSL